MGLKTCMPPYAAAKDLLRETMRNKEGRGEKRRRRGERYSLAHNGKRCSCGSNVDRDGSTLVVHQRKTRSEERKRKAPEEEGEERRQARSEEEKGRRGCKGSV